MTQSSPLVSAVIPTYNRTERLRRAVRSVAAQTYGNIELVVVDDNSVTPASEVIDDIDLDGLVRVKHIRHEENRGANAARNNGIRAAEGEYVAFLDDDDTWEPEKTERQVAVFRAADPAVGVVYTGIRFISDGTVGTTVSTLRGDITKDLLKGKSLSQFSAVMVRHDAIEAAGLPDERFPSWQDREWYLRLSQHCQFEPLPELLTVRRTGHDERISADFEKKRDISYPLFLRKHRSLAVEYGPLVERQFVAGLTEMLARGALWNGYYAEARQYMLRAVRYYPIRSLDFYKLFLCTLGGEYTFRPAQRLARMLRS